MSLRKCCPTNADCEVNKGAKQIYTQTGEKVTLTFVEYDTDLCTEYIISYKSFNFKKWLLWTLLFNIAGYVLRLHMQESSILTVLLSTVSVAVILKLNVKVCQESLLVSSSIGVQLTTRFIFGRTKSHFYDISEVQDIVINEGITLHQVIFYLTLVIQDFKCGKKLVPVYSHCWPCLDSLQLIYKDVQRILGHNKQSQLGDLSS